MSYIYYAVITSCLLYCRPPSCWCSPVHGYRRAPQGKCIHEDECEAAMKNANYTEEEIKQLEAKNAATPDSRMDSSGLGSGLWQNQKNLLQGGAPSLVSGNNNEDWNTMLGKSGFKNIGDIMNWKGAAAGNFNPFSEQRNFA
ncbi:unnamed protein product, partial [Gongylonema pulchrum]|uniref:SCP domain-containing protein n=1 Tax=Gongylonema pulchrum TaxID=637853 RepID=A0A183F161_9BILA